MTVQSGTSSDQNAETASTTESDTASAGFPKGVKPKDMTPEQQAAYWMSRSRQNEEKAEVASRRAKDYDTLVAERDELRAKNLTEQEKAVETAKAEARQQGEAEALLKFGPQLVQTKFEALIAPRGLDPERVQTLAKHLATGQYLKDDGSVDLDALTAFADAVAPTTSTSTTATRFQADLGQGRRSGEGVAGGDSQSRASALVKAMTSPSGSSNPL